MACVDGFVDYFVFVGPASPLRVLAQGGSPDPSWAFIAPVRPTLLCQYPAAAAEPAGSRPALPPHFPLACFPRDCWLERTERRPQFYTFSTTLADATRLHAGALVVYREDVATAENKEGLTCKCFAPLCICVLSRYPFYRPLKSILTTLLKFARYGGCGAVERWVQCVVDDVPLPPPGTTVVLPTPFGEDIRVRRPGPAELPLMDLGLRSVFGCVGVDAVVTLFDCMLQECKVIFTSRSLSLLNAAAEAASRLLYPLKWPHIYIPALSVHMREFLQAPMPYLIGVPCEDDGSVSLPAEVVALPELLHIDLDTGRVHKGSAIKKSIPDPLRDWLVDSVSKALACEHDMAFESSDPLNWSGKPPAPEPPAEKQIRAVFLEFFLHVMHPYRQFLHFIRKYPKPQVTCYRTGLKKALPSYLAGFVEHLTQSQPFVFFVEGSAFQKPNVFDYAVRRRRLEGNADFLLQPDKCDSTVSYVVPAVDSTGLDLSAARSLRELGTLKAENFSKTKRPFGGFLATGQVVECFEKDEKLLFRDPEPTGQTVQEEDITTFIDICIDSILNSTLSDRKKHLLSSLLTMEDGTLYVSERLAEILARQENPITSAGFDHVVSLVRRIVSDSTEQGDFRAPALLVPTMGRTYRRVDGVAEYLHTAAAGWELWRNSEFWEYFYWKAVQQMREKLHPRFLSTVDDYAGLDEEARRAAVETEDSTLFDAAAETGRCMTSLGVPDAQIHAFVSGLSSLGRLSTPTVELLSQLVANLIRAQAGERSCIEEQRRLADTPAVSHRTSFTMRRSAEAPVVPVDLATLRRQLLVSSRLDAVPPRPRTPQWAQSTVAVPSDGDAVDHVRLVGPALFCAHASGAVAVWDARGPEPVLVSKQQGHRGPVVAVKALGVAVMTAAGDGRVRSWGVSAEALSADEEVKLTSPVTCFDVRGGLTAIGTASGFVMLFAACKGRKQLLGSVALARPPVAALALCYRKSDGALLLLACDAAGAVAVRDTAAPADAEALFTLRCGCACVGLAASGLACYTADAKRRLHVWDLCDGSRTRKLRAQTGDVACVRYAAAASCVACGTTGGYVEAWAAGTGKRAVSAQCHGGAVTCMALADDGAALVTGAADGSVRVWDVRRLACLVALRGLHADAVRCLCVSEGRVVSASRDGAMKLYPLYMLDAQCDDTQQQQQQGEKAAVVGGTEDTMGNGEGFGEGSIGRSRRMFSSFLRSMANVPASLAKGQGTPEAPPPS
eukprot:m51a1_g7139 hypothetical protein (1236) ;mRNA; f:286251-291089